MNKKIKSILFYSSIAIISSASVGAGTYLIVKNLQKTDTPKIKEIENNWENVPINFKEFSQNNSFQVQFQIYPSFYTFGTAWSWYYKKISQYTYDWYLMTNFHVVNEAVAYENNLITLSNDQVKITDTNLLLNYYSSNKETEYTKNFVLKKYNGYEYKTILNSYNNHYMNGLESVTIITDFNNDDINLFSESENGITQYNLDMAIIKLSLKFNDEKHLSYFTSPNVWEMYENLDQISKNNFNSNLENSNTYIAGNPYEHKQLVGVLLSKNSWKKTSKSTNLDGEGEEYAVLRNLKAPYFYSYDSYRNFLLTGGSSGSAIYLVDIDSSDLDLNQIIPNGIYWGGSENKITQDFTPSYIPFVVEDVYNVFDNFKQYINKT